MDALVVAASAVGGLAVGDLLEPLADRLPAHLAVDRPFRRCPYCLEATGGPGRLPLVRLVMPPAPCASCGRGHLHPRRPLLAAVLTAVVFVAFALRFGDDLALLTYDVVGAALVLVAIIDVETKLVPNRLIYPALAASLPLFVLTAWVDHRFSSLGWAGAAGGAEVAVLGTLYLAYPQGMGLGDVRLALLVGAATGWFGWKAAIIGFFLAFVLGAIGGIIVLVVARTGRRTAIPFAPYLVVGALVTIVFTSPILHLAHPFISPGG